VGAQLLFNIGVAMSLFHRGVGIPLRVISRTAVGLGLLVFPGVLLVMAVFIFVARPLTVLLCLLPDRRGGWNRNEILFLSWSRYTGVIPAAVASLLLARGVGGAEIAISMVALAACATLLLQATTAGYLAKRLGRIEDAERPEPG
jgi:potassium/hydrogen antiporter